MQNKLQKILLNILLVILLASCNQEEVPPSPTPTPTPSIEYPISFLRGYWELIEYTIGGEAMDIAPVQPVYFNFSSKFGNSWSGGLIYKCYVDPVDSKGVNYTLDFVSPDHFEVMIGESNDNKCDPELEPYIQEAGKVYYMDRYSMEGEILLLHGTDPDTGEDMVMAWERTKGISYHK